MKAKNLILRYENYLTSVNETPSTYFNIIPDGFELVSSQDAGTGFINHRLALRRNCQGYILIEGRDPLNGLSNIRCFASANTLLAHVLRMRYDACPYYKALYKRMTKTLGDE